MKSIINNISYYLLFLILTTFICSIFNLLGINSTITNLIIFIFNSIAFFIEGYNNGKKALKKGYIAGLKMGSILLFLLFIINIIMSKKIITISLIIYYIILLLLSIVGGMIGIQKKKED